MKKHTFRGVLAIALLLMVFVVAWFWWLPIWLNQKIENSLANQGFTVEQLTWGHIGWYSSQIKTLRLRAINNHTQWAISNLSVQYQPMALFNKHLTDVRLHASAVHCQWFQDPYASPITLVSPLAWLAVVPLGLIEVDELHVSQYINQQLLHRWRGRIKVKQGAVNARLSELENARFRGMVAFLTVTQQGDVYASVQLGDTPLASLQGALHEVNDTMQFDAMITLKIATLLQQFPVQLAESPLKGQGSASLQLKAIINKGRYQTPNDIINSLAIELDWHFNGVLKQKDWHADGNINGHIGLHNHKGTWRIVADTLTAKAKDWNFKIGKHQLQGTFHLGNGEMYAALNAGAFITWDTLRWHTLMLDGAVFHNQTSLRGSWLGRSSAWDTLITIPTVSWMKQQFSSTSIRLLLPAPAANHALNATLSIQDFRWDNAAIHLPKGDVTVTLNWHKKVQASLRYNYGGQRPWQFDMAWQPDTGKGHINFDVALNKPEAHLKQWFPSSRPLFKKLSLPLGVISAKGKLSLDAGLWQGRGRLLLKDLAGGYSKKTFADLDADLPFTFNSKGIQLSQGTINVADIDAGIAIHNLNIHLALGHRIGHNTRLNIAQLVFNTLGGQVLASDIAIDTAKLDDKMGNPFTVRVKNIDIAAVLALEQQQKMEATGILDGVFPSNIRRAGLFVRQGTLTARPPGGVIRYRENASMRAMTAANMGAKLAFQVLNNFQYHQLNAKVDYDADGRLLLGLHVKGNNPAYDHGRPIEFNIQVKENLLDLMQSLSMADRISDHITQRVEKKENP